MGKILILMGVSGSGKSTIGLKLADLTGLTFIEADDYHPAKNVAKMSKGVPLNDEDRFPWLEALHQQLVRHQNKGCILACSALKESYRERLTLQLKAEVIWIFLKGEYDLIAERLHAREGHFMNPVLLESQFQSLEAPENAQLIDISNSFESIIKQIKSILV